MIKLMKNFVFILSVVGIFFLTGCSEEKPASAPIVVKKTTPKVAQDVVKEENELIEKKSLQEWEPILVKANLFRPFFNVGVSEVPRSPLECCDTMQFKITIIISGPAMDKSYATVVDPGGTKHNVTEGMYMGLNSGKVVNIDRNGITVREPITDKKGDVVDTVDILVPVESARE